MNRDDLILIKKAFMQVPEVVNLFLEENTLIVIINTPSYREDVMNRLLDIELQLMDRGALTSSVRYVPFRMERLYNEQRRFDSGRFWERV